MPQFSHLHVHTQYSLLDGAADISKLLKTAKSMNMPSMAITDHGNMFGVPKFVSEANKVGVKPIIGCEFYVALDHTDKTNNVRYHQLILAKNATGYKNLSKLCSLGFTDGYYYKPRIDRALLRKHGEGLIATTCCLASEINRAIILKGEDEAEKIFLDYLDIFGEDYYIELQRHGIPEQDTCNEVLLRWSKKYGVKCIATNDVHYVEQKDSEAQDILLCLQTGKDFDDPNRMRFENDKFYLTSPEEMEKTFSDVVESLDNTNEIFDKIETPDLKRDILLPNFNLPQGFISEDDYLRHLTIKGAAKRYGELSSEVVERLDFELKVIKDMGFAGYFLIVQDFVEAAKQIGVSVGPGRGSAAGSAVAYCTGITNIDPIKYNLLFERFLNPERVSMPDIDIDFDDAGRQRVIDYVVDKYGKNRVAQIITFGTMAAKSSIKDVARVLKLPLSEAERLTKLVPDTPGISLKKAFDEVKELAQARKNGDILMAKTLEFAEVLEGSARHTGIHAAGIIIAPSDLQELLPVCTNKDSELLVTQYDGKYVENVGMLKMDFLGLKTLTIIDNAIEIIEQNRGVKIIADDIPLDDVKTYELYQKADTVGTFQFESEGMRKYLTELKPTDIEDLIAMNALYRPGPMDFIPDYIACKHGRKKVEYPHELLEDLLKPTFGIMVYQEQIMQAAQIMGGFSLGSADLLRRAMGKKQADVMEKQKEIFVAGAGEKGVDKKKAEEVFGYMAKFAEYGFNRSHSAAYSVLAYQTAYLKANYTAEYMAAVLTNNMSDIKKVTFFMEDCRRQGIEVLGPDVNESRYMFTVNKAGQIRFGLGAVKGVGESAVNSIIEERESEGNFKSIFDLTTRINLRSANKRCLESLAQAGAFDAFLNVHRRQYIFPDQTGVPNGIDLAVRYGNNQQEHKNSSQGSLFGEVAETTIPEPQLAECEPYTALEQLKKEKDVIGMYVSGHPLDMYKYEIDQFCNSGLEELKDLDRFKGKELRFAGIITDAQHRVTKNGKPFGVLSLEDYQGSYTLNLFSEDYIRLKQYLDKDRVGFIYVTAKVQSRYNNSDQLELKVQNIMHLSELFDKKAKGVVLELGLSRVNKEFVEKISGMVMESPGNCEIKFRILDTEDNYQIELPSQTRKIRVSREFLDELNEIQGLKWTLN